MNEKGSKVDKTATPFHQQKGIMRDVERANCNSDETSLLTASTSSLSDSYDDNHRFVENSETNDLRHGSSTKSSLHLKQRRRNNNPRAHRNTRSHRTREKYATNKQHHFNDLKSLKQQPVLSGAAKRRASLGSTLSTCDIVLGSQHRQRLASFENALFDSSSANDSADAFIFNTCQRRKSLGHSSSMKELVPGGRSGAAQRRGSLGANSYLNDEILHADPNWNSSKIGQVVAPTATHVVVECSPQQNEWSPLLWQKVQTLNRSSQSLFSHAWSLGDNHEKKFSKASMTWMDHGSGQSEKHHDNGRSNFWSDLVCCERHPKELSETSPLVSELQNKTKIRKSRSLNALLVDDEEEGRPRRSPWNGSDGNFNVKPAPRRTHSNPRLSDGEDEFRQNEDKKVDGRTIRKSKSANALLLGDDEVKRQRRSRRNCSDDDDGDAKPAPRRTHSNPRLSDAEDEFRQNEDKKVDGGTIRKSKSTNALLLGDDEVKGQRRSRRNCPDDDDGDVKPAHRRSHVNPHLSADQYWSDRDYLQSTRSDKNKGDNIRKASIMDVFIVDGAEKSKMPLAERTQSDLKLIDLASSRHDDTRANRNQKRNEGDLRRNGSNTSLSKFLTMTNLRAGQNEMHVS